VSADIQTASLAFADGRRNQGPGEATDSLTVVAVLVGMTAAVAAGATIWLVLTEPVTVARALDSRELAPLVRRLVEVLARAVAAALDYL